MIEREASVRRPNFALYIAFAVRPHRDGDRDVRAGARIFGALGGSARRTRGLWVRAGCGAHPSTRDEPSLRAGGTAVAMAASGSAARLGSAESPLAEFGSAGVRGRRVCGACGRQVCAGGGVCGVAG